MTANFAKVIACHDEFCDAVRKYKVRERVTLRLGLELGLELELVRLRVAARCSICV